MKNFFNGVNIIETIKPWPESRLPQEIRRRGQRWIDDWRALGQLPVCYVVRRDVILGMHLFLVHRSLESLFCESRTLWGRVCAVTFHIIELFVLFDFFLTWKTFYFSFFFLFDNLLEDVFDCMSWLMSRDQRSSRPAFPLPRSSGPTVFSFRKRVSPSPKL